MAAQAPRGHAMGLKTLEHDITQASSYGGYDVKPMYETIKLQCKRNAMSMQIPCQFKIQCKRKSNSMQLRCNQICNLDACPAPRCRGGVLACWWLVAVRLLADWCPAASLAAGRQAAGWLVACLAGYIQGGRQLYWRQATNHRPLCGLAWTPIHRPLYRSR